MGKSTGRPRVTDVAMTVRVPKKLHEQARRRAAAELRSVASLTRTALLEYIEARAS